MKTMYERWKDSLESGKEKTMAMYERTKADIIESLGLTEEEQQNGYFLAAFDKLNEGCAVCVSVEQSMEAMRLFRDCTDEEFDQFVRDWSENEDGLQSELALLSIIRMRDGFKKDKK